MKITPITTTSSLPASKPKEKSYKSQAASVLPSSGLENDILDIHFEGRVSTRSHKTSGEEGKPPRKPNQQGKAQPAPPIEPRRSKRLAEKAQKKAEQEHEQELKILIEQQRKEAEALGEPKTPWVWDEVSQKHYTTTPCGSLMSGPSFESNLTLPPTLSVSMRDRVTRELLRPFARDPELRMQKDQEAKDYIKQLKRGAGQD